MDCTTHRTDDGERLQKLLKVAESSGKGRKVQSRGGDLWKNCIDELSNQHFPALGREKYQNNGKFVKISLENDVKSIHDAHPIKLGQILKQYFSGHTDQQKSKNCITLRTKDKKQFTTVMALKQKVEIDVSGSPESIKFEELAARNSVKGIVFEKSWNQLSEEEIKAELISERYEVRNVKQMTKKDLNGSVVKTGGCIITFDQDELPERIKLSGISYRIRQYFPNPLVCGKCLKVGHIRANCKAEYDVCRNCGDSMEAMHECKQSPICPNCPEDDNRHKPNGTNCQRMAFERKIIRHKLIYKTSFAQAREACIIDLQQKTQSWSKVSQETTDDNMNDSNNDSSAIDLEMVDVRKQIEEIKRKRAELAKLKQDLTEQIASYEAELQDIHDAQQKLKDVELRLKNEKRVTRNSRSRSRSCDNTRVTRTIATLKKSIPDNSESVTRIEVEKEVELMPQTQKNRFKSVTDKAANNNTQISWYKTIKEFVPVDVNNI